MKKTRFILITTLLVYLIFSTFTTAAASSNQLQEVSEMASAVIEQDLTVNKWEVLVKEKVSKETAEKTIQWVENNQKDITYSEEDLGKIKKLIWNTQKSDGINESFIVVIPVEGNYDYQVMYKLTGNNWNKEMVKAQQSSISSTIDELFSGNMTKFSCLNTQPDGNIDSDVFTKKLLKKWNVQPLKQIQENDFVVLSGYTSHWQTAVPTADKPMNVQIAAREGLGGKTTLTIGTPIIVTEY
ncbi:YwmB family TATA-box binding protein [Aquibacillus salsiterrae]|uniref:YwmB family TATA-box binding protein n=1 Tax=Aquibacillus salsiterrae TaxID=2950439 RepID=A0A9X3WC65_9BACI|nr:YwmB family TATA-box binding protein [Aquibacillus salsiterrae]MDC3416727.1 YwmB family TATA-box binding protein [Aquibacillus salsiterrae]